MITKLRLKFGRTPELDAEDIPVTPVTVFVGPNNSGKSKILNEIRHFCFTGEKDSTAVILEELSLMKLSELKAQEAISHLTLHPNYGESLSANHILIGNRGSRNQVPHDELKRYVQDPSLHTPAYCQWFLKHITLMLDGPSRINLVNQQNAGDLQQYPQTSFQVLFRDDIKRHEVRRIVADAFGTYFIIDPTKLGALRIRLSARPPVSDLEERGIHDEAVKYHAAALPIEHASDGVKAFTGIVTEVIAGDPRIILIDEPEAFLHPSLSFKLGIELARAALSSEKRVFVSTHSPSFVMGCIQSGAPVNIIRLTYRDGIATARVLPSGEILELMRNDERQSNFPTSDN